MDQYLSRISETVLSNVTVLVTGDRVQYLWNKSFEVALSKTLTEIFDAGWNSALAEQTEGLNSTPTKAPKKSKE